MVAAKSKKTNSAKPMGNTKEELGYDPDKGIGKVIFFFQRNPMYFIVAIVVVVAIVGAMMWNGVSKRNAEKAEQEKISSEINKKISESNQGTDIGKGTDQQLLASQDSLKESYGNPPSGYIWDWGGELLSLGDTSMTSEEVLYAYLKGISSLDLATVRKYSRDSAVYSTYSSYFDEVNNSVETGDSNFGFEKNLYRQAMLSLQVDSIASTTLFTNNKVSYTVNVKMLDYSDKTFTDSAENRASIFEALDKYTNSEDDKTKAKQYLQDWLLKYYTSGKAKLYNKQVDITLQKYPDLNTGWLVSIDNDLDNNFKYSDGNGVYDYVMNNYQDWYVDKIANDAQKKADQNAAQQGNSGSGSDGQ